VPLVATDLVRAAVMARSVLNGEIEPIEARSGGLDVLAQVIVSTVCGQSWRLDDLFNLVRRCDPYRTLPRRAFDLVVEMLAGRHSDHRLRELRPLVDVDRIDGTVRARPGAERTVYLAGGTIPDRGYFHLRVADSGALLGELDEEFVWERSVGDAFTLGVQAWRVERVTHNDVFVRPAGGRAALAPFWRAEERDRPFGLSEAIGSFLERAEAALDGEEFRLALEREYCLDRDAAAALVDLLRRQRAALGGRLPHRHRVVVERVVDPQGRGEGEQLVLHTLWGGRVNRPLALAIAAAYERHRGAPLEVEHDDDCVLVSAAAPVDVAELLRAVAAAGVEVLVRSRLAATGFFGARFREAAACALCHQLPFAPRRGG
jgi:ATP-dependent Lhr-like helicase